MDELERMLGAVIGGVRTWEEEWEPFVRHPSLDVAGVRLQEILAEYAARLRDNYPFFHPRYAGQMLKPPHPVALAAYAGAMLVNPNNHALDGGPATAAMEKECVAAIAAMFGLPKQTLGHLTTSGTIANLEALWIARELRPAERIVVGANAHYTHERMAGLLRLELETLPMDRVGRVDLDALEASLRRGGVGTVILTAGTTGLGAVDPIAEAVQLACRHGARVHVDAAYGGFYRILADSNSAGLASEIRSDLRAISDADSVVVDPHKHGCQPYGCGCVLFRDPAVGAIYRHDSPYTYFTSDELHLGEISLECSRAGASAGALWATLQAFPLTPDGLGRILGSCRNAARNWFALLQDSDALQAFVEPALDVVTFFPRGSRSPAALDAASQDLFERAMRDASDPIFLSVLRVGARLLPSGLNRDEVGDPVRILRSVLMKPEHEAWVPRLHARLEALATGQS